jgi:hypothetical protein
MKFKISNSTRCSVQASATQVIDNQLNTFKPSHNQRQAMGPHLSNAAFPRTTDMAQALSVTVGAHSTPPINSTIRVKTAHNKLQRRTPLWTAPQKSWLKPSYSTLQISVKSTNSRTQLAWVITVKYAKHPEYSTVNYSLLRLSRCLSCTTQSTNFKSYYESLTVTSLSLRRHTKAQKTYTW